jgi:hypothetical protein
MRNPLCADARTARGGENGNWKREKGKGEDPVRIKVCFPYSNFYFPFSLFFQPKDAQLKLSATGARNVMGVYPFSPAAKWSWKRAAGRERIAAL